MHRVVQKAAATSQEASKLTTEKQPRACSTTVLGDIVLCLHSQPRKLPIA